MGRRFGLVSLVQKLRETRVLAGFSRVFPENEQTPEERKAMLWRAQPKTQERWLPAYVPALSCISLAIGTSVSISPFAWNRTASLMVEVTRTLTWGHPLPAGVTRPDLGDALPGSSRKKFRGSATWPSHYRETSIGPA